MIIEVKSLAQLENEINSGGRVVVLFTQPNFCQPCRAFKPHYERASQEINDVKFLYVDLDDVPDLAVRYELRSVPTVKLYENGTFVRDIKAPQGAIPFIKELG